LRRADVRPIAASDGPEANEADLLVLDHLVSAGVEPSASLTVDERTPFDTVVVPVADADRGMSLHETVAAWVLVGPTSEA
jgi:hypothetical protein